MFQGKREGGDRSRNGLVPGTFKPYRYRGRKVGLTVEERADDIETQEAIQEDDERRRRREDPADV